MLWWVQGCEKAAWGRLSKICPTFYFEYLITSSSVTWENAPCTMHLLTWERRYPRPGLFIFGYQLDMHNIGTDHMTHFISALFSSTWMWSRISTHQHMSSPEFFTHKALLVVMRSQIVPEVAPQFLYTPSYHTNYSRRTQLSSVNLAICCC